MKRVDIGPVDKEYVSQYNIWIWVDIEILWESQTFSVSWSRVDDGTVIHTFRDGKLNRGDPISSIGWSNKNEVAWGSAFEMAMRICAIQYALNTNCSVGKYIDVSCSCSSCPPGAGSVQGSTLCKLCPPGTYSDGEGSCKTCPRGMSSDEGSSGESACFDCPAGMYSASEGGYCRPCPLGKTSRAGTEEEIGCFEWSYVGIDLSNVTEWTIHDKENLKIANHACGQDHSQSLEVCTDGESSDKDVASYVFEETMKPQHLQYFYFEWTTSSGGGIRLLNEQKETVVGVFTDNPQLEVDYQAGFVPIHRGPSGGNSPYEICVQVDVIIDWNTKLFSVAWTRLDDNLVVYSFANGTLKHGGTLKEIRWSNGKDGEWSSNFYMQMRLSGVRLVIPGPSASPTPSMSVSSSPTPTSTRTSSSFPTPSISSSAGLSPSATSTSTLSRTATTTLTSSATPTPTSTISPTPSGTASVTNSRASSSAPTPSTSSSVTGTWSSTHTSAVSKTAANNLTSSYSPTHTWTSSMSHIPSGTAALANSRASSDSTTIPWKTFLPSSSPSATSTLITTDYSHLNQTSPYGGKGARVREKPVKLILVNCKGDSRVQHKYRPKRKGKPK